MASVPGAKAGSSAARAAREAAESACRRALGPHGLTFRVADWSDIPVLPEEANLGMMGLHAEVKWRQMVDFVGQGKVVITDRLHASITSVLTGKRHIMLEQLTGKLGAVRSVAFGVAPQHCTAENLHASTASSLQEALAEAVRTLSTVGYFN